MTGTTNQSTKDLSNTTSVTFRFVTHEKILEYESKGWKVVSRMEDSHHGRWSVIMEKIN
jgi:hypothetical protein